MATVEVRKLNASGTVIMTYTLTVFQTFNDTINTPVAPVPLPEEDSSEQILVKVEGNSTQILISWMIKEYAADQITGTGFTGNSKTVFEQILGIKEQFRPVSINDAFQIAIVDGGSDIIFWDGTITQIIANFSSMSPVAATGTIRFMEGDVVTLYNSDGAKQPTNFTATGGGASGEIDLTWTVPTDTGTGNPALTGFRTQHRTGNAEWTSTDVTPSAALDTITGLVGGSTYEVRVSSTTANSIGDYSKILTAVATV